MTKLASDPAIPQAMSAESALVERATPLLESSDSPIQPTLAAQSELVAIRSTPSNEFTLRPAGKIRHRLEALQ
jgi:hypothetical protein